MERKYFEINEENAKVAHDMMSMDDYTAGSVTTSYKNDVDKVYDLADRVIDIKPASALRVERLAVRYAAKMAEYYNRESSIGMICPSVMISGAGNFPVKKKERQVAAWDRNHQFYTEIQKIATKIEGVLYGKEIIKSSDADVVEKLEEKLEDLRSKQELMKAANKAIRQKDIEAGNDTLRELGFSEKSIANLRTPDYLGQLGYPNFELTNNNANIHRIEDRLKSIRASKEKGTSERAYDTFKAIENTEIMRYQIVFDGKPDDTIRSLLKSKGFKWAPSQGAWQRQITPNGKRAFVRVVEELKKNDSENRE